MILDAVGNPIEKPETVQDKIAKGGRQFKKVWILFAAALASVALVVTNYQTISGFIFAPKPSIELVKVTTKRDHVEIMLKNRGTATGLVTGCELVLESTYESEFQLVEQMRFLNVKKEFQIKLEPDEKHYELDGFRLELKSDEAVVFVVKFDDEDVPWTCIDGRLKFELEGNQILTSERFESTTSGYVATPFLWESQNEKFKSLLEGVRLFSKNPDSSVGSFTKYLQEFDQDMKSPK